MKKEHMGHATLNYHTRLRVMRFPAGLAALILSASALSNMATAQTNPAPRAGALFQAPLQAPVGHRQPRAHDLPSSVTRAEGSSTAADKAIDRKLEICRGC